MHLFVRSLILSLFFPALVFAETFSASLSEVVPLLKKHPRILVESARVNPVLHTLGFDFSAYRNELPAKLTPEILSRALSISFSPDISIPLNPSPLEDSIFVERLLEDIVNTTSLRVTITPSEVKNFIRSLDLLKMECRSVQNQRPKEGKIQKFALAGERREVRYPYWIDCVQLLSPISDFEWAALFIYSSDGYAGMNGTLRSSSLPTDLEQAKDALLSLFAASGIFKLGTESQVTFRGVTRAYPSCGSEAPPPKTKLLAPSQAAKAICQYYEQMKEYQDCGFFSTSRQWSVAETFTAQSEAEVDPSGEVDARIHDPNDRGLGIVMEIHSRRGLEMTGISVRPWESEVLLPPATRFKISRVQIAVLKKEVMFFDLIDQASFDLLNCDDPKLMEKGNGRMTQVHLTLDEI